MEKTGLFVWYLNIYIYRPIKITYNLDYSILFMLLPILETLAALGGIVDTQYGSI